MAERQLRARAQYVQLECSALWVSKLALALIFNAIELYRNVGLFALLKFRLAVLVKTDTIVLK